MSNHGRPDLSDIFDRIANKAFHAERKCVAREIAEPMAYADAFRAEFGKRTCATCVHSFDSEHTQPYQFACNEGIGETTHCGGPARQPFSCSLWSAKLTEPTP